MKVLIANRGEIAIRIARAAADLQMSSVGVYSECDASSLHVKRVDEAVSLEGRGPRAYLDIAQIVAAARASGCDAIHPGYGFLSENADFARRCEEEGLTFVGPPPSCLDLFGDKARSRALAESLGVPVVPGMSRSVDLSEAESFFGTLPDGAAMLIKAIGGGGGRGMRVVRSASEAEDAFSRATSEAGSAFGRSEVLVEQLLTRARHVEVQIIGDGRVVLALGDRDCTLQRRHQKLIEVAPAPGLPGDVRKALTAAAVRLAEESDYRSLGTFEFLVSPDADQGFAFIEANARLQVEHTVTEEVLGLDLVQLQLQLAEGENLDELGVTEQEFEPRGFAVQCRVNLETMTATGEAKPSGGTLGSFDVPSGSGVRIDTYGYSGYTTNPNFDSLLAKVIVRSARSDFSQALDRAARALADFRIEGVSTNLGFLQSLLRDPSVQGWQVHTRMVDERAAELIVREASGPPRFFSNEPVAAADGRAGVKVDSSDPLAVLEHGKSGGYSTVSQDAAATASDTVRVPDGMTALRAPMQGTVVSVEVREGEDVPMSSVVLIMEAMKMEHEVRAKVAGRLAELTATPGDTVYEGHVLALIEEDPEIGSAADDVADVDLDFVRPDLAEVHARHEVTLDAARPDAVAKRRKTNQQTARENIDQLCDPDSFVEHGQLVLTPGTGLPREEVIRKFPTDGMITGVGSINGEHFDGEAARCVVMSYDYTVLAGTQGAVNHPKTDRMLELADRWRRPVVLFAEGGGGRAGTGGKRKGGQSTTKAGQGRDDGAYRPLDTPTFTSMARLSGLVPLVGITSRFCFAGNAALLGCCDVIIATADSSLGMGGPALIEGGGLGVFRPEEVGPMDVQVPNGVVDVAVETEEDAVTAAKQYLSYFQGPLSSWDSADQRLLRRIVPENRLRVYNVRDVIHTLADTDSVLELRPDFGHGMITALARIEGRPIGILANNPQHLSGAIDSPGSDKGARFMQLCDAFDLPLLVLCDTPGMMVGPAIEQTGIVRHCSRLFVTGANLSVPVLTIVLRKAYGLGAQAMAGGDFKQPFFTVAWPTGEFGGMGLEGQVKLGFRNELAAIEDTAERAARYQELVDAAYERGRALNSGASFAVDDVIDPADSRSLVSRALESVPAPLPRAGKKRNFVDTW